MSQFDERIEVSVCRELAAFGVAGGWVRECSYGRRIGVKQYPACAVSGGVGLRAAIESLQDSRNGGVYCAGTAAFPD